jgi:hypothetical protein
LRVGAGFAVARSLIKGRIKERASSASRAAIRPTSFLLSTLPLSNRLKSKRAIGVKPLVNGNCPVMTVLKEKYQNDRATDCCEGDLRGELKIALQARADKCPAQREKHEL